MSAPPKPLRKDLPSNQGGVALAWKHGYRMASGNLRTDGRSLWSWRLKIGVTRDGCKCAIDYRGKVSGSTTRQCDLAIVAADTSEGAP